MIVPQPPGGGFDLVARTLAEPLSRLLATPVIVENRPGAGMLVGTEAAAKAEPDGYTLLLGAKPNLAFNSGLYEKLPYDPRADFVPLGIATFNTYTLVARSDLPLGSLKEVLDYARKHPRKLTYASAGNGTGQHITAAVSFHLAGVELTHVPYKGADAAYQDLIPGRVDLFFDNSATAQPHIDAGKVKAIAVSTPKRLSAPVVARLRAEFAKVIAMPEVVALLEKRGYVVPHYTEAEAEALVSADIEKWARLIRNAGIRASN